MLEFVVRAQIKRQIEIENWKLKQWINVLCSTNIYTVHKQTVVIRYISEPVINIMYEYTVLNI
jgi:hypothetical protein